MTDCYLRQLRVEDAGDVLAAFWSNDDMLRQGSVTSLADAERYVKNLLQPSQRPVVIAKKDRLVGLVCVSIDQDNQSGWFWYWMNESARGQGAMSRAAATVANAALTDWGLERLELGHRANNPTSGAVARAAGFIKEGTERAKFLIDGERIDVYTYGRLITDPIPNTPHLSWRSGRL